MRRTRLAILAAWLAWSLLGAGLVAWGPIQHMRNQGSVDGGYGAGKTAANAAFGLPALVWFVGRLALIGWSVLAMGRDPLRSAALSERDRLRREREPSRGFYGGFMALCAIDFVVMGAGMIAEEAILAAAGQRLLPAISDTTATSEKSRVERRRFCAAAARAKRRSTTSRRFPGCRGSRAEARGRRSRWGSCSSASASWGCGAALTSFAGRGRAHDAAFSPPRSVSFWNGSGAFRASRCAPPSVSCAEHREGIAAPVGR